MSKRTENVIVIQVKPLHDPMNREGDDTETEEDKETEKSEEAEETVYSITSVDNTRSTENCNIELAGVDFRVVRSTDTVDDIQSLNSKEIEENQQAAAVIDLKAGDNVEDLKKKRKKDKKRRKKREKKEKIKENDGQQFTDNKHMSYDNDEIEKKTIPRRLSPIFQQKDEDLIKSQVKNVEKSGCFGFISTWIAKRKEKRRQKKRQAIDARRNISGEKLKHYEHKQSKGGEAFTVALNNKIMTRRPVLPPIRPKSKLNGPRNNKFDQAETRRMEHLIKKKEAGAEYNRRRLENAERKADMEYGYKTKAQLTIIAKQGQARRNKNKMDQERRCPSVLRRVPSTMPPASPTSSDIVLE